MINDMYIKMTENETDINKLKLIYSEYCERENELIKELKEIRQQAEVLEKRRGEVESIIGADYAVINVKYYIAEKIGMIILNEEKA